MINQQQLPPSPFFTIEVCIDCLDAATGLTSHELGRDIDHALSTIDWDTQRPYPAATLDGSFFSWSDCEGCGQEAGTRYDLVVLHN